MTAAALHCETPNVIYTWLGTPFDCVTPETNTLIVTVACIACMLVDVLIGSATSR